MTKRGDRKNDTNEFFTPDTLVCEMLDKLPDEVWIEGKTFLDPCVGNGNFLVRIFLIKIDLGHDPAGSLKTLFGADIMKDNIEECRNRLLDILAKKMPITKEHLDIVNRNIKWLDPTIYPNGSLGYDFEFKESP